MAFEYLMSDLLLSNNVVRFVDNLKFIRHFKYPLYGGRMVLREIYIFNPHLPLCKRFSPKLQSLLWLFSKVWNYNLYKNSVYVSLKAEIGNTMTIMDLK
ncbi:hypothetical protein BACFRA24663_07705 [Bacteroides fragilis]